MSEREKMLAGELYDAADPELKAGRARAREIVYRLNQLPPSQLTERNVLFRNLFGQTGQYFHIELPFRCDYGNHIFLGENFYSNYNCTMLDVATITIGNNVMFAPNVSLFTAGHPIDPEKRNSGLEFGMPITIGDNVWIGGNTVVMPNVNIGNNVVIGAGSVVTKDIPDNSVAVGNPCKVLRQINDNDKIYYFKDRKF
ncbi:sugar O-acetyltransferase [Glaesserella sp.]|uniref:sugar O-acetyltransferase n=1 Tax=Glaesserella sp. TaxID=2094731 RepID=UPI0035A18FD3